MDFSKTSTKAGVAAAAAAALFLLYKHCNGSCNAAAPRPKSVKLTYFDGKGRAEATRLCLAIGGVEFEDVRMKGEDWGKLKPTMPHGVVPCVEVDGTKINQSGACLRYAAKLAGLVPGNALDEASANMVVDGLIDMKQGLMKALFSGLSDEDKAAAIKKELETTVPKWVGIIEAQITANGSGTFIVGDSMSYADVALFDTFDQLTEKTGYKVDAAANPRLAGLLAAVGNNPRVKAWTAAHSN